MANFSDYQRPFSDRITSLASYLAVEIEKKSERAIPKCRLQLSHPDRGLRGFFRKEGRGLTRSYVSEWNETGAIIDYGS